MFKCFVVFLLAFLAKGQAEVLVEMDNGAYPCTKKSSTLFTCRDGEKNILVFKNSFGFSAMEKTDDSLPVMRMVSKVSEDDKVLFEVPKFALSSGGGMGGFNTPTNTRTYKLMVAHGIISTLKDIHDDLAKDIVSSAESFIQKEKTPKTKIQVVAGEKKLNCEKGKDRPLTAEEKVQQSLNNFTFQCSYYACQGPKGEKILAFVPPLGAAGSPYLVVHNGENSELKADDLKVVDPSDEGGDPLYTVPKNDFTSYPSYSVIDQNLFVPKKFEKNKSTFSFYTNPFTEAIRESQYDLCSGKDAVSEMIAEDKSIADGFKTALANAELAHYLTLVNGQLWSMFIDAEKGRGLGCRYGNMIVSSSAAEHLAWLEKAKVRPVQKYLTEEEVQDLFKKAKSMEDIPFGYKYDGCYARAHVMARRFEAMGIPTEKVWIKGTLSVPGTDIQWNYHVAPVINVKTKTGEIKKYVIDPSLNERAVTVEGWVDSMAKNVKGGVVETQYPFPFNVANFQRTAVAFSSSDIYVPDNDEVRTEEQNMALAMQTMKEYAAALKQKSN